MWTVVHPAAGLHLRRRCGAAGRWRRSGRRTLSSIAPRQYAALVVPKQHHDRGGGRPSRNAAYIRQRVSSAAATAGSFSYRLPARGAPASEREGWPSRRAHRSTDFA